MKTFRKVLFVTILLLVSSYMAHAAQVKTPLGVSDTNIEVGVDGLPKIDFSRLNNPASLQSNKTFGFLLGSRTATQQNVRCDVWEGPTCVYVFPASPIQMRVISSSTNDTAAGTGARTIEIKYLDTDYVEQVEIVTLNGTTPVSTVATNILRVNRCRVLTAGSNASTVGTISIQAVGGAVTYDVIVPMTAASRKAVFTVPANRTGYVQHWDMSTGSSAGNHLTIVSLRATAFNGFTETPGIFTSIDEMAGQDSHVDMVFPIPVRIPEKTDVKITAISDGASANVTVYGTIFGWFETE